MILFPSIKNLSHLFMLMFLIFLNCREKSIATKPSQEVAWKQRRVEHFQIFPQDSFIKTRNGNVWFHYTLLRVYFSIERQNSEAQLFTSAVYKEILNVSECSKEKSSHDEFATSLPMGRLHSLGEFHRISWTVPVNGE